MDLNHGPRSLLRAPLVTKVPGKYWALNNFFLFLHFIPFGYQIFYLFNLYAEYIMRNAGLDEAQAGIKIAGRNINNLRYADDTTLMAENEN